MKGHFKTARLAYGNHYDQVMEAFLSRGWALHTKVDPDYKKGDNYMYLTFLGGENAKEVILNLPNAYLI